MKNIKSQGHVEVIISFALFVGFLLIVFIFINPFSKPQEKKSYIEQIQNFIIKKININVGMTSVFINSGGTCYYFPTSPGYNLTEVPDSRISNKYVIYISKELNQKTSQNFINCRNDNFTLGVYSEEDIIFYPKIKELKQKYDGNYLNLKGELGVDQDFLFIFKYLNGTIIDEISTEKKTPVSVERESKEIPVKVIDENGNELNLLLNIRSW